MLTQTSKRHTVKRGAVNGVERSSSMAIKTIARTGHRAPKSGQYRPSGSSGREITLSKGDVTPPNNFGVRQQFILVDATKHKKR